MKTWINKWTVSFLSFAVFMITAGVYTFTAIKPVVAPDRVVQAATSPMINISELEQLIAQVRTSGEAPNPAQQIEEFKHEIAVSGRKLPVGNELRANCPKFPGACHLAFEEHEGDKIQLRLLIESSQADAQVQLFRDALAALESGSFELSMTTCALGNSRGCLVAGRYSNTLENADHSIQVASHLCQIGVEDACETATLNAKAKFDLVRGDCLKTCDKTRVAVVQAATRAFREVTMTSCRNGAPWSCEEITRTFGKTSPGQALEAEMKLEELCKVRADACEALKLVYIRNKDVIGANAVITGQCGPGKTGSCLRSAAWKQRSSRKNQKS